MTQADIEIRECIEAGQSFLLDAGAGSGKTYSLVEALRVILGTRRKTLAANGQSIACVTFTNVAKDEISERIGHDKLVRVSTIHDFLWEVIQRHQHALKAAVAKYNNDLPEKNARKKEAAELAAALAVVPITYSDTGSNLLKGRLHHDDLLSVAHTMFADNPMLCRLTAARYPYLFIDEYQDTSPVVMETILEYLLPGSVGGFIVGLFGDKMQNIYHGGEHAGLGEIPARFAGNLRSIIKRENRRCSQAVIRVLNRIRTDIEQFPSAGNAEGAAVYIHPGEGGTEGVAKAQAHIVENFGWSIDGAASKELYLTHRLIAQKAGYAELLALYSNRSGFHRDHLLNGEDETIAFFIDKVEPLAAAWEAGDQGKTLSQLRRNGYKLDSNEGKRATRVALDELLKLRRQSTVSKILAQIRAAALFPVLDDLLFRLDGGRKDTDGQDPASIEREEKDRMFYSGLFELPYVQVMAYAKFFAEHTPYATKHGVKGAEFDTVLVVLDDEGANWNLYSFGKYLSGEDNLKNESRWKRSRNVFYVCCSRPKMNLAVIDLTPRSEAKDANARRLFGDEHTIFL
jgi:DNA helicase-2/ATP-dependent DNA helicase PcrA